ncbi:hypothetical protein Anapl_13202 [Anas platyrhynchos]|uniref:Uncharacterized protein n=1 Tax=Anas platyrhynchos TaxID=8839 RepID=R0M788_ANAPL|nr:hypothetical protein Anapl_13202 [Anas platyrhynchos]
MISIHRKHDCHCVSAVRSATPVSFAPLQVTAGITLRKHGCFKALQRRCLRKAANSGDGHGSPHREGFWSGALPQQQQQQQAEVTARHPPEPGSAAAAPAAAPAEENAAHRHRARPLRKPPTRGQGKQASPRCCRRQRCH